MIASITRADRRDVVPRQPADDPEGLFLGEPVRRDLDGELARGVGQARGRPGRRATRTSIGRPEATGAPYWYLATTSPLDRLAAVVDGPGEVEGEVELLELVRLDLERPGEIAPARLEEADAVRADGAPEVEPIASWKVPNSESLAVSTAIRSRPRAS